MPWDDSHLDTKKFRRKIEALGQNFIKIQKTFLIYSFTYKKNPQGRVYLWTQAVRRIIKFRLNLSLPVNLQLYCNLPECFIFCLLIIKKFTASKIIAHLPASPILWPFKVWCPLKGHTCLNKPAAFSCRISDVRGLSTLTSFFIRSRHFFVKFCCNYSYLLHMFLSGTKWF